MQRLSVVIANYDYERFVAAAIESALALDGAAAGVEIEVVVVDDGSTDGSRAVIQRYADRITPLWNENGGQREALNCGFAASTGDVVVFLDSDDVLPSDLPVRLVAAWTPTTSKAQFRMQRIDADGRLIGRPFPAFDPPPSPADIRRWVTRTSAYPTPPGSGNAYARDFLERIFPVGDELGSAADSAPLAAAPLFGDVVTVPEIVVGYRQHDRNDSDLTRDDHRFPREVRRARARWQFAQRAVGVRGPVDDAPLFRSRELLQLRVAARRVAPAERPLPGDRRLRMLVDTLRSPWQVGPESTAHRARIAGWCLATLVAPESLARRLVALRYGRSR